MKSRFLPILFLVGGYLGCGEYDEALDAGSAPVLLWVGGSDLAIGQARGAGKALGKKHDVEATALVLNVVHTEAHLAAVGPQGSQTEQPTCAFDLECEAGSPSQAEFACGGTQGSCGCDCDPTGQCACSCQGNGAFEFEFEFACEPESQFDFAFETPAAGTFSCGCGWASTGTFLCECAGEGVAPGEAGWSVVSDEPYELDLLSLDGDLYPIVEGTVPDGKLTQIRLILDPVRPATLYGAQDVAVEVPSGPESGFKLVMAPPITVQDGEPVDVELRFEDVRLRQVGDRLILQPTLRRIP